MVASGSRSARGGILLLIFALLLSLFPEEAEAKRRRGSRMKKGGAKQVRAARRAGGGNRGRRVVRRNNNNNDIFAIDENNVFGGSFDLGRLRGRGIFRPVVINGQVLDIAQDENGLLFPLAPGVANSVFDPSTGQAGLVPVTGLSSSNNLIVDRRGRIVPLIDSGGLGLGQNVIQSIQFFNAGGRPE